MKALLQNVQYISGGILPSDKWPIVNDNETCFRILYRIIITRILPMKTSILMVVHLKGITVTRPTEIA